MPRNTSLRGSGTSKRRPLLRIGGRSASKRCCGPLRRSTGRSGYIKPVVLTTASWFEVGNHFGEASKRSRSAEAVGLGASTLPDGSVRISK